MIPASEFCDRLDRLERTNRFLKAAVTILCCVAAAVAVMGAASTAPKEIDVQKITLRDSTGNERGQLFAADNGWGLIFFNKNKTKAASLGVGSGMNALALFDQNGNMRQVISSNLDDSAWNVFRPGSDTAQFQVVDSNQGTIMSIRDKGNNPRVEVGYSANGSVLNMSDSNGAIRTSVSGGNLGFASFAEDGSLAWAPGWDKFSPEEQEKMRALMPKAPR
jgi:hypothetical protein